MSHSKLDCVWKFLSDNADIRNDTSNIEHLRCIICKMLAIDSCQSQCGCLYCFECFNAYVGNENKYCPGEKAHCKEEHLVFDCNVFRNAAVNMQISKIQINCPNHSCECTVEMIQLLNHMRLCTKQPIECPYVSIGCCLENATKEAILTHVHEECLPHTELLINCINNLKHDHNELQKDLGKTEMLLTATIENISANWKDELAKAKIDFQEELKKMKNEMELTMKAEIDKLRQDIERKSASEEHSIKMNNVENKMADVTNNWRQLYPKIEADFVWRVDNCSRIKDRAMYSDPFSSNLYKFSLQLYIYSDNSFIVRIFIMTGDSDDLVKWPMKRIVRLGFIDPVTREPYDWVAYDIHCARPMTVICDTGTYKMSTEASRTSIKVNDCLIISCVFNHP